MFLSQGFTNGSTLGEFRPKTRIAGGSVGVDGRRNIKSLPGWRQMFDHADKSFYWLNIKNHSTQWHHPYEQKKTVEKSWDGKKAEVAIRKEKHGIVIGHADHWLNEYQSAPSGATETTRLKTKQTVLAMIHRWSLKWEKISEAFRGMEIRENGEISRAQLRTALIRFNVSYNDSLLEDVWSFLDPSDTGTVKISILTDFVMNNDPLKHKRSGGPSHDRFHGVGTESQEQIQLRNAAEERNNFARSMLLNMTHLQNSLSRGEVAGKMNRLGLTSVLAHTKLTPKNADLIGEFDAYLTELRGGTYTKDDINVETINRFARKYALKLPQGQSQPKKAVIWSPVDGGARKPVIDKLPPDFRPHIQLIREKLFSKYNNPRMAFLHLDKEQKGAIAYAEFKKSVLAMELYVPMIAIDFLWNKIDDDGQGVVRNVFVRARDILALS
jgi:Ca2+-binding EF-hand superfamily protein